MHLFIFCMLHILYRCGLFNPPPLNPLRSDHPYEAFKELNKSMQDSLEVITVEHDDVIFFLTNSSNEQKGNRMHCKNDMEAAVQVALSNIFREDPGKRFDWKRKDDLEILTQLCPACRVIIWRPQCLRVLTHTRFTK